MCMHLYGPRNQILQFGWVNSHKCRITFNKMKVRSPGLISDAEPRYTQQRVVGPQKG